MTTNSNNRDDEIEWEDAKFPYTMETNTEDPSLSLKHPKLKTHISRLLSQMFIF